MSRISEAIAEKNRCSGISQTQGSNSCDYKMICQKHCISKHHFKGHLLLSVLNHPRVSLVSITISQLFVARDTYLRRHPVQHHHQQRLPLLLHSNHPALQKPEPHQKQKQLRQLLPQFQDALPHPPWRQPFQCAMTFITLGQKKTI